METSSRRFLPTAEIVQCEDYRSAVRLAWARRNRPHMTQRQLAEECCLYPPHVSSYLHSESVNKHGARRLDLPADRITAFERSVGNHAITQYLTRLGMLTLMEEVIETRRP